MYSECIHLPALPDKLTGMADAATSTVDGMTVRRSSFTRADEAKTWQLHINLNERGRMLASWGRRRQPHPRAPLP